MTNQLFTLRKIVDVNGKSHIDRDVLTFVPLNPLCNEFPQDFTSSLFRNFSDNVAI